MTIGPFNGKFTDPKSMLYRIAEDDTIEQFVIVTVKKDGDVQFAHYECSRANLAFASLLIQQSAIT